jgi:hypothetical protein
MPILLILSLRFLYFIFYNIDIFRLQFLSITKTGWIHATTINSDDKYSSWDLVMDWDNVLLQIYNHTVTNILQIYV